MKRCKDCGNWKQDVSKVAGACHLNPPTVTPGMMAPMASWPATSEDDFCGSFEPSAECMMGEDADREHPEIRSSEVTRPVEMQTFHKGSCRG